MSTFALLQLKNVTRNRSFYEKCLGQLKFRLYYHNNIDQRQGSTAKDSNYRRKELKVKLLRNLQKTKEKVEEIIEKENIWTVPNFICVGRILATPVLGYLIVSEEYKIALCMLGFAGLSDLADGWIARTWTSQASKIGSFLDPVADKLLVGTLFLSLAWVGLIPMPLTYLVIARDVALISGASYIRYLSIPPPKTLARYFDPTFATVQLAPTLLSKINTGIQLSLVAGTLAAPVFDFIDHPVLHGLCYLTAITTIAGGFSYLVSKDTYKVLARKKSPRDNSRNSRL